MRSFQGHSAMTTWHFRSLLPFWTAAERAAVSMTKTTRPPDWCHQSGTDGILNGFRLVYRPDSVYYLPYQSRGGRHDWEEADLQELYLLEDSVRTQRGMPQKPSYTGNLQGRNWIHGVAENHPMVMVRRTYTQMFYHRLCRMLWPRRTRSVRTAATGNQSRVTMASAEDTPLNLEMESPNFQWPSTLCGAAISRWKSNLLTTTYHPQLRSPYPQSPAIAAPAQLVDTQELSVKVCRHQIEVVFWRPVEISFIWHQFCYFKSTQ